MATNEIMSVDEYIAQVPVERKSGFLKLRDTIKKNLPKGFEERISYGMISYCVPLKTFPAGYHCAPGQPLPFISIANQKNFLALYHMGIYAEKELLDWFTVSYPKHTQARLDMGKSCIRFKKPEDIPFDLIAELAAKRQPKQWVDVYTTLLNAPRENKNKKS